MSADNADKAQKGGEGRTSSKAAAGCKFLEFKENFSNSNFIVVDTETASEAEPEQKPTESKQSEEQKLKPQAAGQKKQDDVSNQSVGLTSSLAETSEDEEAKKKAEEKAAKKAKKGLSQKELDQDVDIELTETETSWFLHIPSVKTPHEDPEYAQVDAANKAYDSLLQSKVGSDNYN